MTAPSTTFRNPVLSGFHPDPSICRVGDDYYLVCSSFEYFPGVPIFHSRDLVNWQQIGNVLDRPGQLRLPPDTHASRGIFAPTIRHHDGRFWMITTDVTLGRHLLVTAVDPAGPWSDPVYFDLPHVDPSLAWDDNGDCWLTVSGSPIASIRRPAPSWKGRCRCGPAPVGSTPRPRTCTGSANGGTCSSPKAGPTPGTRSPSPGPAVSGGRSSRGR